LKKWARPRQYHPFMINRPAQCHSSHAPYGSALIIGPWNYPAALVLLPLVHAIAAGNCSILKPSEHAPVTSRCIRTIMERGFDPAYLSVVEGGPDVVNELIDAKPDFIFFTGGKNTGSIIMAQAARAIIPLALELGGKNPCIIDAAFDLKVAARRIVWGKFFNAGQSCMAPDYCLIPKNRAVQFSQYLQQEITVQFGTDPARSPDYGRIVNRFHFDRLNRLLKGGRIIHGGIASARDLYISPTVIDGVDWDSPVMTEEIFGPILPILHFDHPQSVPGIVNRTPHPLAVYCFSDDPVFRLSISNGIQTGNICFNGTLHLTLATGLPFGGVGKSGMGRYHGQAGFEQFSYMRSVMEKSGRFEFTAMYPPYLVPVRLLAWLRKLLF
jgi:aldehyde dehydrogenase (NAD+)